jgi:cytochrome P450
MRSVPATDWNPASEEVLRDQRSAFDAMRESCPVAWSEQLQWSLFRHEDVVRALEDHETFSNGVSKHLSVPNGMDPPEHTQYRTIIEPYFAPAPMKAFAGICRRIVDELVAGIGPGDVELMERLALPFAVRVQCAFLGWPAELHEQLVGWIQRNREATRAQDRTALSGLAREFEAIIDDQLERRRSADAPPEQDVTSSLMHAQVWGRTLTNEEIASILRNWTAGEIGTISASIGILAQHLAEHPNLQTQLRAEPNRVPEAIEEILRLDGPLAVNRRITTRPVEIGGRKIGAGERITLMWIAANRDGRVFEDPYEFRWGRDLSQNLLWGRGIHVCPGAPLARLELRVCLEALLVRFASIRPSTRAEAARARYPAAGYSATPVSLH